jgi:hypothetical protein
MKKISIALLVILSFILLTGCSIVSLYLYSLERHSPVPFAVQHAGAIVTQDVKLLHDRYYELYLRHYVNGKEKTERVKKLVGAGILRKDESGNMIQANAGIPVYLELKIMGLDEATQKFFFEEKLFVGRFYGASFECLNENCNKDTDKIYFYDRIIKIIRLKPGLYRITLKSLQNIPELEGISIAFKLGWFWNSKPFDAWW